MNRFYLLSNGLKVPGKAKQSKQSNQSKAIKAKLS